MLGLVDATRMRMEEDFRLNRQPNLSRAIVGASRDRWEALGQVQRRMGRAQRDVATTEAGYAQATGANQMQLGHLIVAAIREEYRMDAAPRPAETAVPAQQPLVLTSELRTWPEIPIGYLLAASAGLLGLFLAGLRLPAALEVRRPTEVVNLRTARAIYRETIYPLEIGKGVLASR